MNIMRIYIYVLLIAFLASSNIGLAQNNTGTIKGKVLDEATLQPLPFVNVYLVEAETGTTSDIDGAFTIENIPRKQLKFPLVFALKEIGITAIAVNTTSADSLR